MSLPKDKWWDDRPQVKRWRERETGRFTVAPYLFRLSVAVNNVPWHTQTPQGNYYSFIVQTWAYERSDVAFYDAKRRLINLMAKELRSRPYGEEVVTRGIEKWVKVPYEAGLAGTFDERVEEHRRVRRVKKKHYRRG